MNTPAAPSYHAVTKERHAKLRWRRYDSYRWAAGQHLAPLFAPEFGRAAVQMPIAFVPHGELVVPVAVLGLESGVNLHVGGDGRWLGGYVPAVLRMRPFALLPTPDDQRVLCVDETAGEVGELQGVPDTEPFFTPEGELAPMVQQVMQFVSSIEGTRAPTADAAAALQRHGLLVPWRISLETDAGTRQVEGLLRVDEAALAALGDEAYLDLRRAQAVPVLYAHLLSVQHLQALGQLARAHAAAMQQQKVMPVTTDGELDLSFMNGGDTLRFS